MHQFANGMVKIRILGPVTVEVAGQRRGVLPPQLRKVLAVLAVTREVSLSTEQIVRRTWDGDPPSSAVQMVRNHIRSLRRLSPAARHDTVIRDHSGYRLAADAVEIDAEQFTSLVRRCRTERSSNDATGAVHALQRALRLWSGPEALADVRDVPVLQVAATGLEELRYQAEEMVAESYLALGRPEDALPTLSAMTILHPSRELPWVRLMAAQALIGRRIEASGVTFRQAQHHLVEQTGLDAPLLARVHQAVLRDVPGEELVEIVLTGGGRRADRSVRTGNAPTARDM